MESKKFKVYIVADEYKWWDFSRNPSVFQEWIQRMIDSADEKEFQFLTRYYDQKSFDREVKILNAMESKSSSKKPVSDHLKMVDHQEEAQILKFPSKD